MRSVASRVAKMIPIARKLLDEGIDARRVEFCEHVEAEEPDGLSDKQMDQAIDWAVSHYELGIAVGLLLNPATFLKGGAR